jgi:hypothetical protein
VTACIISKTLGVLWTVQVKVSNELSLDNNGHFLPHVGMFESLTPVQPSISLYAQHGENDAPWHSLFYLASSAVLEGACLTPLSVPGSSNTSTLQTVEQREYEQRIQTGQVKVVDRPSQGCFFD